MGKNAVRLRPAVPGDASLLQRWRAEASVRQFQPLSHLTLGQLRADLAGQRMGDLYRGRGEKFQWIVEVEGKGAGWVTLVVGNWEHGLAEVGYALSTSYQSQGVMSRGLALLLDDIFTHTTLERIEARCASDNVASQRVLEKTGFEQEGLLRGYFKLRGRRVDNFVYGLLREEWQERRI
jgi:ribosomal-protein-alanine N-acetyltransferase